MLRAAAILLLALAAGAAGWALGRGALPADPFTRQRLAFLEAENGRLRSTLAAIQKTEAAARDTTLRAGIEADLARLRELDFKRPVAYREIGRERLPVILRQKLLQQVPEKEFADNGIALAALGLLPPGTDLEKTCLALLGEQIGAFYDQHTRELFTFTGRPLTNAQNRVVMAHELTHALQDQHYDLARLPLEAKGNDDRSLAASALIEGDATLAMNRYLLGDLTAASIKDSLAGALATDVTQLAAAPRYLRETLLFPYRHGLTFCQTLYEEGGWAALGAAYADPPASTAQILHPAKYLAEPREAPVPIDFPDREILGQKPLVDNVLGEFGARQWFNAWLRDDARAAAVAAGWRGDRYLVYGNARANSWIWFIACADAGSARNFAEAAQAGVYRRRGVTHSNGGGPSGTVAKAGERDLRTAVTAANEVIVIDAQDTPWAAALAERFAPGLHFP